jgi:hypothetical protein
MRRCLALVLLLLCSLPVPVALAAPTYYNVTLSSAGDNVFRDQPSGLVILTQACGLYVYGQTATLIYEPYSYGNKVYFADYRQSCAVSGVYAPNAHLSMVADDLYQDSRSGQYLQTWGCSVPSSGEDVLVVNRRVLFLDSNEECRLN